MIATTTVISSDKKQSLAEHFKFMNSVGVSK